MDDLERLEKNAPLILCKLEKIFPPAFFDIMIHLIVHLPKEAKLGGPVHPRWMFPFERYFFLICLTTNFVILLNILFWIEN